MESSTDSKQIYVSFRGHEMAFAAIIYAQLEARFGNVARLSEIEVQYGQDLQQALRGKVRRAVAVVVLIGPSWLEQAPADDFVTLEVAEALRLGTPVIPVLLEDTPMPSVDELPRSLSTLAELQVLRVRTARMQSDLVGVINALEQFVEPAAPAPRQAQRRRGDRRKKAGRDSKAARTNEFGNWHLIKETGSVDDLRDHIARFSGGQTEPWARDRLAALVWEELEGEPTREELEDYIAEFPTSPHRLEAQRRLGTVVGRPTRGGVFISYRRDDSRLWALLLYAVVAERIGSDRVFLDSVNIPFGDDYEQYVRRELPGYGLALVLMGPDWRGERADGRPRIEDANDLYRIEIELALAHDLTILPVVLEGLTPPHATDMPASIATVRKLNMYELSAAKFEQEHPRLLDAIVEHHQETTTANPAFAVGAGFGGTNRALLESVDRIVQTKLDRFARSLLVSGVAVALLAVAGVSVAIWWMVR